MKIVIAADKFKHSLSSFAVCNAIREGLLLASPQFSITSLPLSDGGDGLADVLAYYHSFEKIRAVVNNPVWKPVEATFLFSEKEKVAFVEMAQASGLQLLQPPEYNCALTTTYGTGELIKNAIQKGARTIIIGIGGSATNDCGIGMATALGYRFLDRNGEDVEPIGKNLSRIQSISAPSTTALQEVQFQVACDVTNYLTGEGGATKVYGPQKGATPAMIEALEAGMQHFAGVVKKEFDVEMTTIKGGGAAGGLGAGCVAFLQADLVSGAAVAFQFSRAEAHIRNADVVITGEGKLDEQTWNGKLVDAVTALCRKHRKPVVALCGTVDQAPEQLQSSGLTAAFSILQEPMPLEEALQQAGPLLSRTAFAVGQLLKLKLPS